MPKAPPKRPAPKPSTKPAGPPSQASPRGKRAALGTGKVEPLATVAPPEADASEALAPEAQILEPELVPPAGALPVLGDDTGDHSLPDGVLPVAGLVKGPLAKRAPAGSLTQSDALRSYMAEVSRHKLLTREEENELAWRYFKDPEANVDAAYRLVTANLRLVVKLAYQYRRAAFNILDLIQEGNIGLMQAVKKFDPGKGIKLSSYAAWWIRAYILRHIMDNFRLVKLGTTEAQRKLFFNLRKEQEKLIAQGIEAGPKLLAERLNVSEQDVQEMQGRMGNEELSLDAPVGRSDEDKRQTGIDRLQSGSSAVDDVLADAQVQEQFHEKLKAFGQELTGKEKTIFDERMVNEQPLTLQEIGDKYGLTRERVRQLEAQLTRKLRAYMAKELPDFKDLSFEKPDK